LARLDSFFAQHIARWSKSDLPSLFLNERNHECYRQLAVFVASTGRLLFTEATLDGEPVVYRFGFISEHDLIWYQPTYLIAHARSSPGEVLLRELFLGAGKRSLGGLDFTRGNEPFKRRFSDQERRAVTFVLHHRWNVAVWQKSRQFLTG
jgi:CelD/BcsL family acetyltransferase involved in cellulose biosynthesis